MPAADEKQRIRSIVRALRREYPEPRCGLVHESPFQLLIATILSAQCTDERVNQVTPGLFAKWGAPADLATVPLPLLEDEIRSTGFFRNKARNVRGAAQAIVERHGGEVPATMAELIDLPGVARKTANVVLGIAFAKAEGIVVDTHVTRVSQRLGLSDATDPVKIEQDLMTRLPRSEWIWFGHALIWHGRDTCGARRPACERCALARWCPAARP
jgi:endonuclease-3